MVCMKQTQIRVGDELMERLHRFAARLRSEQPGLTVKLSDVIRILLGKGLDVVEKQTAKRQ